MGALTPKEIEVMNLWEAGLGIPAIARYTGMAQYQARSVVSRYHPTREQRATDAAMVVGNAQLLSALASAGRPRAYTGPFPIHSHRTLAEVPACAE